MSGPFRPAPRFGMRVVEAAPARRRIGLLIWLVFAAFGLLSARALYLGLPGESAPQTTVARIGPAQRAALLDRTGAPLAVTAPTWTLAARPREVWDPQAVAAALAKAAPGLDRADTLRRLQERDRGLVYLKRNVDDVERARVFALGLPGVVFEPGSRRRYPNGAVAAHLLGGAGADLLGVAGAERALDARLMARDAGPVRLALDLRLQHALERELAAAQAETGAAGAAGVLLDGRTGEALALASLPSFDPNAPPPGDDPRRLNRAAGAVYELGSVVKPLLFAAALDAGVVRLNEAIPAEPFAVEGVPVRDVLPAEGALTLAQALARSSNTVSARLALRLGPVRLAEAYARAGLLTRSALALPETGSPLPPRDTGQPLTAAMSYGYGFAAPLIALAEAYTAFCNDGARVPASLAALAPGDPIARTTAFSPEAARAVLAMMRGAVEDGTARRAGEGGVALAGKTGTAEKPRRDGSGYDPDRQLATFAGVFPADAPRYVIVVALDEPARAVAAGGQATGGAVAAPTAARVLGRIAPLLDIASDAGAEEAAP